MRKENRCGWHETNENVPTPGYKYSKFWFVSLTTTIQRVCEGGRKRKTKTNPNRKRRQQTKKTRHPEHMGADVDTNLSVIPFSSQGPMYQNKIGRKRSINRTNNQYAHKHEPSRPHAHPEPEDGLVNIRMIRRKISSHKGDKKSLVGKQNNQIKDI